MIMKTKLRYQDFIDELARGSDYGVFIDDTGSPGGTTYKLLPSNRKTWVAVVISPSKIRETYYHFGALLRDLKKRFKVSELHFTDIFGGRGEFAKIEWKDRLGIFNTLAKAFTEYSYPIFIQSLEPYQLSEWKEKLKLPESISVFNFKKLEDTALFLLLLKVRMYIKNNQLIEPGVAHVFVDEGWKKNGIGLISSVIFSPEFDRNKVCFGSSKDIILLQLADFAAFVLNRMQIAGGKEVVKNKERHMLQIVKPMVHLYQDVTQKQLIIHNETGKAQQINPADPAQAPGR